LSQQSTGLSTEERAGRRWSMRMRTKELSEYLDVEWGIKLAPATLHKLRCQGGGVPFQMDGKYPVSTQPQADGFAVKRLGPERTSTSDTQMAA
jgi:hypothetical protein